MPYLNCGQHLLLVAVAGTSVGLNIGDGMTLQSKA